MYCNIYHVIQQATYRHCCLVMYIWELFFNVLLSTGLAVEVHIKFTCIKCDLTFLSHYYYNPNMVKLLAQELLSVQDMCQPATT